MFDRPAVIYQYDGSLDGFLCCVFESYVRKEEPMDIQSMEEASGSLFPSRPIPTDSGHAARVARWLISISPKVWDTVEDGFLCPLTDREILLYRFIRMAHREGASCLSRLTDDTIARLEQGIRHLRQEAHLFTGFIRFTCWQGALTAKIHPKGQVLPLIASHFAGRYPQERFLIFDETHKSALVHQPGRTAILPVEQLTLPPVSQEEALYRQLWQAYHQAISIQERENPRCQRTHLPLRYRGDMTEFLPPSQADSPSLEDFHLSPKKVTIY